MQLKVGHLPLEFFNRFQIFQGALPLFCRYENRTQIDLKDFVEYVLKAKAETKYDGTIDGWDQQWSTPNAILFTVSIMTIVGYGNISPKTVNAQVQK